MGCARNPVVTPLELSPLAARGHHPVNSPRGGRSGPTGCERPAPRVSSAGMSDVTRLIDAAAAGEPRAAAELLPLVYAELRQLAAGRLAAERPGQTLQATALVHEAYLRLVGVDAGRSWDSRAHFFAAAAEAMRRILIDQARHKRRPKHGGGRVRLS